MTSLTLVTIAVIGYGVFGAYGYCRALALGGVTAAGAAVAAGAVVVPTFYAVALGTAVALVFQFLRQSRRASSRPTSLPPGVPMLLLFFGWSVLVTVTAPELFDGLVVFLAPGTGKLYAGTLTSSNLAQVLYLALGVCVVVFVARARSAGPELIGLAAGTLTLLSLWRYLHQQFGVPFPEGFFDNSPNFAYIETAPGGVPRFRGIQSEPSALAGSSLVTIAYVAARAPQLTGRRRVGAWIVAVAAGYLGVVSTSGAFVVSSVVLALIAAVTFLTGFLTRRRYVSAVVGVVSCVLIIASLWLLPIVADFVGATVNAKVASSSFEDRAGANDSAYGVFFDTYGLGVGLGANRASSLLPGLLGVTGVVGALLLAATIFGLIRRGGRVYRYRPVVWALVAVLVVKVVSGPDLSDTTGVTWLALGLLSRAAAFPATGLPAAGDEPAEARGRAARSSTAVGASGRPR